ncbi:hypothetical protein AB0I82_02775 [Streptomyces sp. NPDC050315]
MHGAQDPFVTPGMVDKDVAWRFPQAHAATVDEAGHWPHLEQPMP